MLPISGVAPELESSGINMPRICPPMAPAMVFPSVPRSTFLAAPAATLPPTAPLMIWMIRLMSIPDITSHSPDPVFSFQRRARRRTIAARYNLGVYAGKVMLRLRKIQTKVQRSFRDRLHVVQASLKQALRMRAQAAERRTKENRSRSSTTSRKTISTYQPKDGVMSLKLYFHPLSSFCWKALVALYENETPFTPVSVDLSNETERAALLKLWPIGKFPVLRDDATDRTIPESSIIIEYLDQQYQGHTRFITADAKRALQTRLRDRF